MKKVLPIGIDNFCDIISNNCYYVDKTNYIKTVLTTGNKVLMLTRPRRFGKSLFIDTVRCFLQLDPNQPGNNCINKKLFSNLEITKDANFCNKYMGQYPVISISLKDIEGANFNRAYAMFASKMQRVISQYAFLLNSPHLDQIELSTLKNYLTPGFLRDIENIDDAQNLLNNLIIWLFKHFERRVVVLIDEYDVPLAKAAEFGYYDQMLHLIRSFLAQALKEDPYAFNLNDTPLLKAVLTGCLRVSKESLFTGMNNLEINTVVSEDTSFAGTIGFTETETTELLEYCSLTSRRLDVKQWCNGYKFANEDIYCPWDVINFCNNANRSSNPLEYQPENYWDGTGSTSSIQEFLSFLKEDDAERMQLLIDGNQFPLTINDKLTYRDFSLHKSDDFWTLLLFTGYLTVVKRLPGANSYSVRIPNEEIRDAFKRNIKERFSASNQQFVSYGQNFAKAALTGNPVDMGIVLEELLKVYVSVRDLASKAPTENYYHGFLVALLACAGSLAKDIRSNSEAGHGFADLMFTSGMGPRRIGVIIEIKRCNKNEEMYSHATEAINQIKTKRYNDALDKLRCSRQFIYGIAFCRKDFEIVVEEIKPMFA